MGTTGTPVTSEDSGSVTTAIDASTGSVDAAPPNAGDASGMCTDPIPVSIGDTISGSTCGGSYLPFGESPCESGGPVAYFYVEAPAGAPIRIDSTTPLNMSGYDGCAVPPQQCTFDQTSFAPSETNLRLFTVQLNSDNCGDFTITVTNQ
jgi:hypothetical protein